LRGGNPQLLLPEPVRHVELDYFCHDATTPIHIRIGSGRTVGPF
jgi:hypothetical protein